MISVVYVLCLFCFCCVQVSHQKPERCLQKPDIGMCKARKPRLYYDPATNSCIEFIFGGCGGNENNFETIDDCDSVCVKETRTTVFGDRCTLKPVTGNCRASIPRQYYDYETNTCKNFIYGGCDGNENNFETVENCQIACVKNNTPNGERCKYKPESGQCMARIPRLYYDGESNTCKEFIYGGCGGNANNFLTAQECDEACVSMSNICSLPKEEGPCKSKIQRIYYDANSKTCKEFFYGGCEGNKNNFEHLEECDNTCKNRNEDLPVETCLQKAEPGNCQGMFYRFYYNLATKKCGEFVYGGCGGNKNNFEHLEECENTCIKRTEDLPVETCLQKAEPGNCLAMFYRFYYNSTTKKCGEFVYGGCGGNKNNFMTKMECELECVNQASIQSQASLFIIVISVPIFLIRFW